MTPLARIAERQIAAETTDVVQLTVSFLLAWFGIEGNSGVRQMLYRIVMPIRKSRIHAWANIAA